MRETHDSVKKFLQKIKIVRKVEVINLIIFRCDHLFLKKKRLFLSNSEWCLSVGGEGPWFAGGGVISLNDRSYLLQN